MEVGNGGPVVERAKPQRLTYSVDEVAEVLGISRSKTYELVARGEIPALQLSGRRKLIARKTVEQLVSISDAAQPAPRGSAVDSL